MSTLRLVLRVLAILAGVIVCVPLHYAWIAVRRPSPWPRRFLRWVGRAGGLRARSVGSPTTCRGSTS
jgi:1-acyl-sn-glycerol-3-phosphate acyltransferase